ncbi:MAG: FIST N-terminal domain-containing protein [Phycisphaerae bacterium]|jgi:hypothetical protein
MKVTQKHWTKGEGWQTLSASGADEQAQLVLVFGENAILRQKSLLQEIEQFFPQARMIGCSTSGEIIGSRVFDDSLTATGVFFEKARLQFADTVLDKMEDSFSAGEKLGEALEPNGLTHVFVLSDGLKVNGSSLAKGIQSKLPANVAVTGGLAGDQDRFKETAVFLGNVLKKDNIAVIGFYGDSLQIGYASNGGWDSFGSDRLVTRSKANILYELDGQPALGLYKKYLGEQAKGLPATGLLFPLSISLNGGDKRLVRTILSVNENDGSMTFAGDVPEGNYARLMRASLERLVDGAAESARQSQILGSSVPDLAILVSCVGRKLVLKQRIDEEVECIRDTFGPNTALTGFYSYGEICPVEPDGKQAELHNQTMTITTLSER